MFTHWKYLGVAVLGFLVGATAVAAWVNAHGGDSSLIHSCVTTRSEDDDDNRGGRIRIVGPEDACKKNETALDWNVQGPPGPQGEQGPPAPLAPGGGGLLVSACQTDSGGLRYFVPGDPEPDIGATIHSEFVIPTGGRFLTLAVNPGFNNFERGATLITLLVNRADTPLQVSIPAGSTEVQMAAAEVPVLAGDLVTLEVDATANTGGGGLDPCHATIVFRPD